MPIPFGDHATFSGSVRIGTDSRAASVAGNGAIRINGTAIELSDGATWNVIGSVPFRVVALTDAATVTINLNTTDLGFLLTASQPIFFANPTGSATDGRLLLIRITSAVSRAISFGTEFQTASSLSFPLATTGGGAEDYLAFRRNGNDGKWDFIGSTIGGTVPNAWRSFTQDLGSIPKDSGNFVVTTTGLTTSRQVVVMQGSGSPPNQDDIEWDGITANGFSTSSTTFTCYWSSPAPVMGVKTFNYLQV